MDAPMPCGKFISEDFRITAFVNNCHSELEESFLKPELLAWNNAEETAEVLPGKDADDALIIAKDSLGVEELGTAVDGVHLQEIQEGPSSHVLKSAVEELGTAVDGVHRQEIQEGASSHVLKSGVEELGTAVDGVLKIQEGVSSHILDSGVGEKHHQKIQSMLPELKTDSPTAVTAKVEKNLNKCATFPTKDKTLLSPVSVDVRAESTCTAPAGQCFFKSQNAAYARSFSMPVGSLNPLIANVFTSPDA